MAGAGAWTGVKLGLTVGLCIPLLAGCSTSGSESGTAACELSPNGTAVAAPASGPVSAPPRDLSTDPETASGYRTNMLAVKSHSFAVATANPVATLAACQLLRDGGTAADALIVAQTVLGLVEPQSSGLGGGAFALYYDAGTKTIDAYDGRETAPRAATANYVRWVSDTDRVSPKPNAQASGRSIGVPGVVRMLEMAHRDHGRKQWKSLFDPAIMLADRGVAISPRLARQISVSAAELAIDEPSKAYFLNPDGSPKQAGTVLTNPAMAKTLGALAAEGANAFYTGALARDIVAAAATPAGGRTPGQLTADDLAAYQARKRTALCRPYREREVCGMPAPSSGGIAVAATLGILGNYELSALGPAKVDRNGGIPDPQAVHLIAEAERLAYADRDKYVADTDFVPLPGDSAERLLNPEYLTKRAGQIGRSRAMGSAAAGDLGGVPLGPGGREREHGTSHISIVDSFGNAAAMTTTIESAFGSFHLVGGFPLNNQLTDFAADPAPDGLPLANRVQPGKRPRSSMAPTLIFDRGAGGARGGLHAVLGSPGGSVIIQYVVKAIVSILDWGLDPQQASSGAAFGAANTPITNVGGEHPNINAANQGRDDPVVRRLRELGHQVSVAPQVSGLSVLQRTRAGWIGGADPRREGAVMGDRPQ